MKIKNIAAVIAASLGTFAATAAHADPVASAVSVVSFENFTINYTGTGTQVDAGNFTTLSVESSQLVAASMTGQPGAVQNPSTSTGEDIVAQAVVGTVDPSITGFPATASTVFNVPTLPLVGNFAASGSNDVGSPITNFGVASQDEADLHNASYASLDTLNGTAGTSTSSQLASTFNFTLGQGGSLTFSFDFGAFIAAFLSTDAAQSASASWSINFTLVDESGANQIIGGAFSLGDTVSNNFPGTGSTNFGNDNSTLTGGIVDLTSASFVTNNLLAGVEYTLTANISTRTQVVRRAVPEPESLILLGIGLLGLGFSSGKFKKSTYLTAA